MTEVTTIQTRIARKIIVTNNNRGDDVFLDVNDTSSRPDDGRRVFSMLKQEEAKKVATALLGNNAVVITDLPEAKRDGYGYVESGEAAKYEDTDPDTIEGLAKNLLAIAKFIRTHNAEKEAAEAKRIAEAEAAIKAEAEAEAERLRVAEEAKAKLEKRRDKLATEFLGYPTTYKSRVKAYKQAIDRVIELEDAAEASKYVPF